MKKKTLGLWLAFEGYTPFKREGISRYCYYIVEALLKTTTANIEIWFYPENEKSLSELFLPLLASEQFSRRLSLKTIASSAMEMSTNISAPSESANILKFIKSYILRTFQTAIDNSSIVAWYEFIIFFRISVLAGELLIRNRQLLFLLGIVTLSFFCKVAGFEKFDLLLLCILGIYVVRKIAAIKTIFFSSGDPALAAEFNNKSEADVVLVPYIGLKNSLNIKKPKVYALHDLVTFEFAEMFLKSNNFWGFLKGNLDVFFTVRRAAKKNSIFVSNSKYVMNNHILKFIPGVKTENVDYCYLPLNLPENLRELANFQTSYSNYVFYPSQIRPYKNAIVLVKALEVLRRENLDLKVVFTAKSPDGDVHLKEYMSFLDEDVLRNISFTGDLSEKDLFLYHKNALVTVMPSKFEGGFPWQAIEGLAMATPVAMASIPVTVERIEAEGFSTRESGIGLFQPDDYMQLAEFIKKCHFDKASVYQSQKAFAEKILSYTWNDAASKYCSIFDKMTDS